MTEPRYSPHRQVPSVPAPGPGAGSFPSAPVPAAPPVGVLDTQPIPVVGGQVEGPAGTAASVLLVRSVLALAAAVVALVAAVFLFRQGVTTHGFPAYLQGTTGTDLTRYRGPWIGAAAGAVLVGGLLVLQAVVDLRRRATADPLSDKG